MTSKETELKSRAEWTQTTAEDGELKVHQFRHDTNRQSTTPIALGTEEGTLKSSDLHEIGKISICHEQKDWIAPPTAPLTRHQTISPIHGSLFAAMYVSPFDMLKSPQNRHGFQ